MYLVYKENLQFVLSVTKALRYKILNLKNTSI